MEVGVNVLNKVGVKIDVKMGVGVNVRVLVEVGVNIDVKVGLGVKVRVLVKVGDKLMTPPPTTDVAPKIEREVGV